MVLLPVGAWLLIALRPALYLIIADVLDVLDAPDTINNFFTALTSDLGKMALAIGGCFLAWAGIQYISSGMTGERGKQQALVGIYAVVIGLGLVLLAPTIASMINSAFSGQ
jgi:hypothetical protein